MENSFSKYGLINTVWYNEYLHFLKKPNKKSNNKIKEKLFKFYFLQPIYDERDYSYIGCSNPKFNLPSDFVFVTNKFVNLISEYISIYDYKNLDKFKSYLFQIAIGGECIIMKNFKAEYYDKVYIFIYEENKGNMNNNIDFILMIDDYNKMIKSLNIILEYNIWNFLKIINFSIEEDEKEIKNVKGEKMDILFVMEK